MDQAFLPVLKGAAYLLALYKLCLLGYALFSWLYLFGIIRAGNAFFGRLMELLHVIIDPPLSFLRRYIPSPGGLDLSFIVLFIGVHMTSEIVGMLMQNMLYDLQFSA